MEIFATLLMAARMRAHPIGPGGALTLLTGLVAQLLHIALMAAAAPTLIGLHRWMQARLAGRTGASPLQPWRDLVRLLRKQTVLAESASHVTIDAPVACAAATAVAACLVPSFTLGMTLAPFADLLLISGLLMAARASLALAAMDAGTATGGMAASRTMLLGCLAEPALLLVLFVLALLAGSLDLDVVAAMQLENGGDWRIGVGLALAATLLVALIDAMRREALALDLGGRDLALIEAADALRLLVWFNLIGAMFLPFGMARSGRRAGRLGGRDHHLAGQDAAVRCRAGTAACGAWADRAGARGADARCRGAARPAGRGVPVGRHGDRMIGATGAAGSAAVDRPFVCPADRHGGVALRAAGGARSRVARRGVGRDRAPGLALNGVALPVAIARMNSAAPLTLRGNALVSWAGATVLLLAAVAGMTKVATGGMVAVGTSVALLGLLLVVVRSHALAPVLGLLSSQNGLVLVAGAHPGVSLPAALAVAVPLVPALVLVDHWLRR